MEGGIDEDVFNPSVRDAVEREGASTPPNPLAEVLFALLCSALSSLSLSPLTISSHHPLHLIILYSTPHLPAQFLAQLLIQQLLQPFAIPRVEPNPMGRVIIIAFGAAVVCTGLVRCFFSFFREGGGRQGGKDQR